MDRMRAKLLVMPSSESSGRFLRLHNQYHLDSVELDGTPIEVVPDEWELRRDDKRGAYLQIRVPLSAVSISFDGNGDRCEHHPERVAVGSTADGVPLCSECAQEAATFALSRARGGSDE